jgi:hypothetical protein
VVVSDFQARWGAYESVFGPGGRSELAERGYIDPAAFWQRLQGLRDGQFLPDGVYVQRMLHLETWFRTLRLPRPQRVTVPSTHDDLAGPMAAGAKGELLGVGPRAT